MKDHPFVERDKKHSLENLKKSSLESIDQFQWNLAQSIVMVLKQPLSEQSSTGPLVFIPSESKKERLDGFKNT